MRRIDYIVVHCTAGKQDETIPALLNGFRARGWRNNGYHIVVDGKGVRHDITPLEQVANGVAGKNANSIHVSYMGGWNFQTAKAEDNRTQEQKKALLAILQELRKKFPDARILGHRDLSPDTNKNGKVDKFEWVKVCPSFDAITEYQSI